MKIRTSFVTNSSSTSYCIIGYEFLGGFKELHELLLPQYQNYAALKKGDYEPAKKKIYDDTRLCVHHTEYDSVILGKNIASCDENLSLNELKKQVSRQIEQITTLKDICADIVISENE